MEMCGKPYSLSISTYNPKDQPTYSPTTHTYHTAEDLQLHSTTDPIARPIHPPFIPTNTPTLL